MPGTVVATSSGGARHSRASFYRLSMEVSMANKSTGTDDRDDFRTNTPGDVREDDMGTPRGGIGRGVGRADDLDRDRGTIDRDLDDEIDLDEPGNLGGGNEDRGKRGGS
jgi:hypothetical protein